MVLSIHEFDYLRYVINQWYRKIVFMKKFGVYLVIILVFATFLRIWKIDSVPVSLFGDELDVGYQAYSILKTGRDYSGNFMPLHFHSFAEWRTPLYLYSAVPTVALFGISPLGVRLPAVLFGLAGVFFIYLLSKIIFKREIVALVAGLIFAISPWHIHYSRAAFEVTQMLALYMISIYAFWRGLKNGRWLVVSAVCLALTPWVYSTAKLFAPLTIIVLILLWYKELIAVGRKWLLWSFFALVVVGAPIAYSTAFGGGTTRFSHLSIFTDPTVVPEIGFNRLNDARVRGEKVSFGMQPSLLDRIFHNKISSWVKTFTDNYIKTLSFTFFFVKGDQNLRHGVDRMGVFYKIEFLFFIIGLVSFVVNKSIDKKQKLFVILWLILAPIPSALTRDGASHATRLFFLLPPMIILVASGVWWTLENGYRYKFMRGFTFAAVGGLYTLSFLLYQHNFWYHYPWESERWWNAGFKDAIQTAKSVEDQYEKIIISTNGEPPWIFFAGWYNYPPNEWHKNYPFPKENLNGYGEISHLGKYYFGSPTLKSGIYSMAEFLNEKTLYVANAKEFNLNFILEPGSLPKNLRMVKAISYPSGEPAFYLLTLNAE